LNFNKSGDRVNTLCGGLVSILTGIAIYGFLLLRVKTMALYESNTIGMVSVDSDPVALSKVPVNDTQTLFFFSFLSTAPSNLFQEIKYDEEIFSQYITFTYSG
jgi:hypothetical protein